MSSTGMIQGERATLSGTIQSLVIDKTLMISGAAADSFAAGELARDAIKQARRAEEYADDARASAVAAEAALTQAYTRPQVLSDETKSLFGLDASKVPDDVFKVLSSCAYMEAGSYVGTGTYDNAGVVELTFIAPPDLLMLFDSNGFVLDGQTSGYYRSPTIGYPQALTTEYKGGLFRNNYAVSGGGSGSIRAKRSADGKTISWYTTARGEDDEGNPGYWLPQEGYNESGVSYNYIAFYRRDNA